MRFLLVSEWIATEGSLLNFVGSHSTFSRKRECTDLLEEAHYRQGGAVHWKPQSIQAPVAYCKQGCAGLCRVESHVVPLLLLCKKLGQCPDGAIWKEKQNIRTWAVWMKHHLLKNGNLGIYRFPYQLHRFSQCTSSTISILIFFVSVKESWLFQK